MSRAFESWTETSADGSVRAETMLLMGSEDVIVYQVRIWAPQYSCHILCPYVPEGENAARRAQSIGRAREATRRVLEVVSAAPAVALSGVMEPVWYAIYEGFEMPHPPPSLA